MTSPLPNSVRTDGNIRVDFVSTFADPTDPVLAELNAVSSQPLAGYITGDGYQQSGEQATINDERLATVQTFEQPGRKTKSLTLVYVINPTSPTNNEAYEALAEGTVGYLAVRWGVPREQAWAANDIIDTIPIIAGEPIKQNNGANSVITVSQRCFIRNVWNNDVVVAAA